MNRKQRDQNRATSLALLYRCPPTYVCPRCQTPTHHAHYGGGVIGGEFVGAWSCQPKEEYRDEQHHAD